MVTVKRYQKTVHVEEIIPSVVEPSFVLAEFNRGNYWGTQPSFLTVAQSQLYKISEVHCISNLTQEKKYPQTHAFGQ